MKGLYRFDWRKKRVPRGVEEYLPYEPDPVVREIRACERAKGSKLSAAACIAIADALVEPNLMAGVVPGSLKVGDTEVA